MIVDADEVTAQAIVEERQCFLCGRRVSLPFVEWAGATGEIVLHPRCATSFVLRLAIDCRALEKAADSDLLLGSIDAHAQKESPID